MRKTLGQTLDSGDEKYAFSWAGRNDTFKNIQTTSKGTLIPDRSESVNFEDTENIFIEGENLEILKLLQKSYFGKIKMIYIDPPYNTGNDFIYKDNFHIDGKSYLEQTGQAKGGVKLTSNPYSSGRFHSDWISFMYARLYLARNLLKEDGVIFVSIDDNEVHNLRLILDEIFGEENFIVQLIWNKDGPTDNQLPIRVIHEYVLVYSKNIKFIEQIFSYIISPNISPNSTIHNEQIKNTATKNGTGNPVSEIELPIGFPCNVNELKIKKLNNLKFIKKLKEQTYPTKEMKKIHNKYPILLNDLVVKNYKLVKPLRLLSGWQSANKIKNYISNNCKPLIQEKNLEFYLDHSGDLIYTKDRGSARLILSILRSMGTVMGQELKKLNIEFSYPKPLTLLEYLIKMGSKQNDIILDFFTGSGTTAHAVMELNKEDKGSRKFICVQIPEKNETADNEKFPTIAEICKERIRRAIKNLKDDSAKDLDLGFKVFKLAKSNYEIWKNYEGKDVKELKDQMKLFENPLVEKYKDIDVIYECIIKEGLDLNSKIEKIVTKPNTIYRITEEKTFHICLDETIHENIFENLNLSENDTFICIDAALNDGQKTNLSMACRLKTV